MIQSSVRRSVLLLVAFFLAGRIASAQSEDSPPLPLRAFSSTLQFFTWHAAGPPEILRALEDYEQGRLFDALAAASASLSSPDAKPFRDEAYLIRALALADLGWREQAAQSFAAVLEGQRVSPYYPLALLGLIESYHADGRFDAVAEAYERYFEKPWKDSNRRSLLIRNRFSAYGEIRTGGSRYTTEENDLLSKRASLIEKLRERKERPSERLLYLAGLDLFRIGRYSASLHALERIGIASPYHPYGLYTSAQDLNALGRTKRSRAKIEDLLSFPATTVEEWILANRAGLFRAQLAFESGSLESALTAAGKVGGSGIHALEARLFRAEICLAMDQPSLAIAYYRDLGDMSSGPRLETERALGLSAAYSALGDFHSAVATLKSATEIVTRAGAEVEASGLESYVETLRARAEDEVRQSRRAADQRRQRLAAGIRRVSDFKGPWNLGRLARIVFTAHRNTVIGEPVYDLHLLAEADEAARPEIALGDGFWLDYLKSPLRSAVEAALASLFDTESEGDATAESALRTLDAAMKWLEGRFPRSGGENASEVAAAAVSLGAAVGDGSDDMGSAAAFDLEAPLAPQVSEARRRIVAERTTLPGSNDSKIDASVVTAARQITRHAVSEAVAVGLRQILQQRGDRLRRLEFDLESALSQAMAEEKGNLAPSRTAR